MSFEIGPKIDIIIMNECTIYIMFRILENCCFRIKNGCHFLYYDNNIKLYIFIWVEVQGVLY